MNVGEERVLIHWGKNLRGDSECGKEGEVGEREMMEGKRDG